MNTELVYYLVGAISGGVSVWGWMVMHRPVRRRHINSLEQTRNMRRPIPPTTDGFEGDTRP